jgi:hypothetical protein
MRVPSPGGSDPRGGRNGKGRKRGKHGKLGKRGKDERGVFRAKTAEPG